MKKLDKLILDTINRKIFFNGNCLEVGHLCEAMCCRKWDVNITYKEFQSGIYDTQMYCRSKQGGAAAFRGPDK